MKDQSSEVSTNQSQFDFIGAAIKEMRLQTTSLGSVSRTGAWTFASSDLRSPAGYYILRGQAEVTFEDHAYETLEVGDLLMVLQPMSHTLHSYSAKQSPQITYGEQLSKTFFLYANIHARIANDCPCMTAMPNYLLFRAGERTESPYLDAQLQCLAWETKEGQPASELMREKLWEIIFMQSFRVHLAKARPTHGWLSATCDQQLSKVLAAIHQFPEKNWTVEKLAAEGSMSRATLARRFVATLNETPMDYLFKQRMRIAANMLAELESSISAIAERVGYGSESAFSTAFYRRFNIWPGEFRVKEARNPTTTVVAR